MFPCFFGNGEVKPSPVIKLDSCALAKGDFYLLCREQILDARQVRLQMCTFIKMCTLKEKSPAKRYT